MTAQDDYRQEHRANGSDLGCSLPVDAALSAQGWEWRCNADGTKLRNVVESYRELGFEVRLERLDLSDLSEDCEGCKDTLEQASAVFVKRLGKV